MWNCFAEAGKKTLVFHWPGSSWPPTSDSENLYVIDGTSPGSVGMATSQIESESILGGSIQFTDTRFIPKSPMEASAACVITDLDLDSQNGGIDLLGGVSDMSGDYPAYYVVSRDQMTTSSTEAYVDMVQSQIKEANGWADAPRDAREFEILFSGGLIRRPALIIKDEQGVYSKVAMYKNKKNADPMVVLPLGEMVAEIIDDAFGRR